MRRERGKGGRKKGWWDEKCKKEKRKARLMLMEWRKEIKGKKNYREAKKRYSEICEEKKRGGRKKR